MKKILLPLLMAFYLLVPSSLKADEGMWTLYNLPQAVYEQMRAEGFQLPYNDLYYGQNAIKNAVVNFSGYCSGVVVSPDGLVFTNHHCGFEAIRSHSTVEHDYMLNGFCAKSYEEELPNKNMFVSFMIDQKDVTPRLQRMGFDYKTKAQKEVLIDSLQRLLTDSVKRIDSTLHVDIGAFYEGNKYYATTYQDFTDLRLVFAVPKSMGKFGGETDNWMWPRQTCDFSVFRIYANPKTNGPASYSKDNVPYHPKHWAKVSMQGYKDGDFAMTMGYPGSTSRYLSSYGIREMRDAENIPRAQVRGVKQAVMQKHMRADEAVRIKYDSKYAQSANYWKNSIGMNKCIDSIGIINQKQEYERRIREWQDKTGFLRGKLDFNKMQRLYNKRFDALRTYMYWRETFVRTNEFTTRAMKLLQIPVEGPKDKPKKQYIVFKDNSDEWDASLDKEVLATLLKNYKEHVAAKDLLAFYKDIEIKFGGDYAKFVDFLYENSFLMKSGERIYINKKSYKKDPGVQYSLDLLDFMSEHAGMLNSVSDSINEQEKYLCAAKLRMEEDLPHYSDANFTMRLSYGQVGGFSLGGKPSGYYTTAESIVEKMNRGNEIYEYQAEPIMKKLLSAKDFGPYQDKTSGKMQLCFLTNNDITGGNSGSPMFDGYGNLIGLAFDGNWDSLSSDINFDKRLARCIGVDIRYVLFMMDKWGHADRLLKEIDAK
ncbi:S46 family peptidase [Hoylesella oralis]|uniref:S46 family peptidase n=1 Tax=Hoylesella oralis TaxID=28134 RepID=UPI003620DB95